MLTYHFIPLSNPVNPGLYGLQTFSTENSDKGRHFPPINNIYFNKLRIFAINL